MGWTSGLEEIGACQEAVKWGSAYPDAQAAWDACERGDWMLWWLGRRAGPPMSDGRRRLVGAAAECARTALPIFERLRPGDDRPCKTLDLCERFACGAAVTEKELRAAAHAAAAAADADAAAHADADAAAHAAAYAAAYAAHAAADAAYAAAAAAYAAAAAAYAAHAAERSRVLRECAIIVRRHCPNPPLASEG